MKTLVTSILLWLGTLAIAACAGPVREIEVTSDPEENGQQVFTVRLKPGETRAYDALTFACAYHQEFVRQTTDAEGTKGANEPAVFTYRRKDVRLVDDLDTHVSFRVPVGLKKLQDMYGETAFHPTAPITIARITITASPATGKGWRCTVPATGLHTFPPSAKPSTAAP
jgi:hypothetical protein